MRDKLIRMKQGVYRGMPLNVIPTIYLRWAVDELDLHPDLELDLREELERRDDIMNGRRDRDGRDRWEPIPLSQLGEGRTR